jgi:hypothetical protein
MSSQGHAPWTAQLGAISIVDQSLNDEASIVTDAADQVRDEGVEPTLGFEPRTCCLRSRSAWALWHKRGIASVGRSVSRSTIRACLVLGR